MRKILITALVGTAMVASGPLSAQQSSNGKQTREQSRQNSQGRDNANQRGIDRSNENSVLNGSGGSGGSQDRMNDRRQNSQGSANANERARERASQNSAVQEGMMVHDRNNRMVGRVGEVRRSPTGVIIAIVVVLQVQINGSNTITLPAGSFTVVAGVVIVASITAPSGS